MAVEDSFTKCVAGGDSPALTAGDTPQWANMGTGTRRLEVLMGGELPLPTVHIALPIPPTAAQAPAQPVVGQKVRPSLAVGEMSLVPWAHLRAIDWEVEATRVTFALEPGLLLAATRDVRPDVTGELVWVPQAGLAVSFPLAVRPVFLVCAASASPQAARLELVLHLPAHDPLYCHIALVLQATSTADNRTERLYAEVLANALAVHFLRRYGASGQPVRARPMGLAPSKLRRTTAYIQEHLEQDLSLTALAAVAQMSPAHFARLFKQATGQTPHQYVLLCRMEHAKRLLTETALPLIEIGLQVGCTDQSYFTALFRKLVGTTPKAYRDGTVCE
jgi:AraC-like DNA-binding protein